MRTALIAGSANVALAEAIAEGVGVPHGAVTTERFPDGELSVEIGQSVRGGDVYLLQPTPPPCETHLLELLLLSDAARRAGARRVTAVMPYFGYARQDRRAGRRAPVGARLIADLLGTAGVQRVVAIDLHSPALEGFFGMALEHLSAVANLVEAARPYAEDAVVVAPDLGAARLADRYADALGLPAAIVHKTRISGREVRARRVTGDVRGLSPLIVDDMISTGATIEAAVGALRGAGCTREITVAASHPLLVGGARERLRSLGLRRLIVTDSVPIPVMPDLPVQMVSVAPLLSDVIRRLGAERSLADLAPAG